MPAKRTSPLVQSRWQSTADCGSRVLARRFGRAAAQTALLAMFGAASHCACAGDTFLTGYFVGVPYATAAAYAPGVTLYGVVDEAVGFTKGAQTAFVQQSSGQWTSKFGLYGVEDLGGGYTVRFALESGFNANNGSLSATNTLFNREAWVAIGSRRTGELKFGVQDDIGVPLFVDVFGQVGTVSAVAYLSAWTYDLGPGASYEPGRLPSSVSYSTPWFGPLNAQMAVSLNNQGGRAPTLTTRAAALNYYDGHTFATVSYWGNYGLNSLNSTYVRTDDLAAGIVYDTKNYVLSAGYSFLAPRLDGDRVASLYTAGAIYKYQQRNDFRLELAYRTVAGASDHSLGVTLGYDYDLSKRTALYVRGSLIKNSGAAPRYAGYTGSSQPTVDNIGTQYTGANGALETYQAPHVVLVGMYHKF